MVDLRINGGKPTLMSDLVKTPEGLIAFMKVAITVEPNGYLDTVTRNHDVEYTVAELRHMQKTQICFQGKLPNELSADERITPAYAALVRERNLEYWEADKRMLTAVVAYRPNDFADANTRALMIKGFHVKAGNGLGGEYALPAQTVQAFMQTLKSTDPSIQSDALGVGQRLCTLGQATSLVKSDFEALVTLPISSQERQFFNQHLKVDAHLDTRDAQADGSPLLYGEKDFSHRVVVPKQTAPESNIFEATVKMGQQTITMRLDKSDDTMPPIFTKEISIHGVLVRKETLTTEFSIERDNFGNRAYTLTVEDGKGKLLHASSVAKPDVPSLPSTPELEAKLHAVRTGDYSAVVPEMKSNPYRKVVAAPNALDIQSQSEAGVPKTPFHVYLQQRAAELAQMQRDSGLYPQTWSPPNQITPYEQGKLEARARAQKVDMQASGGLRL